MGFQPMSSTGKMPVNESTVDTHLTVAKASWSEWKCGDFGFQSSAMGWKPMLQKIAEVRSIGIFFIRPVLAILQVAEPVERIDFTIDDKLSSRYSPSA